MAVLAGVPGAEAVAWVRARHHPHAGETPWQLRWVRRLDVEAAASDAQVAVKPQE